ncbi:MAG: hypothetical protein IKB61_05055, partial [Elusimicrobiaceae bacterium]|nr:hypothetical protein [Elusimicrobiaceae bacterium]
RFPQRSRTAARAPDPRPGRRSCSGDLLDPCRRWFPAAAINGILPVYPEKWREVHEHNCWPPTLQD